MSPTERREALAVRLRERVEAQLALGVLRPGDQLPGARDLAKEYGADPRVVLDAFRELERDGVVELRSRSGVYVAPSNEADLARKADWLAAVLHQGLKLGAPSSAIADLVMRGTESLRIRAAIIDCNDDELWSSQQELSRDYGIEASTFLLPDVSAGGRWPAAIREANLIVCTEPHEEEVGRIATLVGATFIPLTTQPGLYAEVRRMLADTEVHFVVSDERYAQKLHYQILQGHSSANLRLHVLGVEDHLDLPADVPFYVSPLARSRAADNAELRAVVERGQPSIRAFSDDTSRALFQMMTRANLAADGATRSAAHGTAITTERKIAIR